MENGYLELWELVWKMGVSNYGNLCGKGYLMGISNYGNFCGKWVSLMMGI